MPRGIPSGIRLVDDIDEVVLATSTVHRSPAILCTSNELTSGSIRDISQDRLGRSGIRDLSSLHDAAQFQANIKIYGDTSMTRYEYLDKIKGMLAPHRRPYIYIKRDGWATERRALLRGDGVSCTVGRTSHAWLDVSLQAIIPDGVIEADNASTITLRPSGGDSIGWTYPFDYPEAYASANLSNTYMIESEGNTFTPPYIVIYGQFTEPSITITNLSTGVTSQIALTGISVASGHFLTIDVAEREIYLDGTRSNSFYNKLDVTNSSWWEIPPGESAITFSANNINDGTVAYVTYRNRWIP